MKTFAVVIPARLASTRLPNKPLIDILGQSLLERTWNQVIKAVDRNLVYVLTDNETIVEHCYERNIQVILTSQDCLTGTDRVAEFAKKTDFDYYINVQGDEPLINPNNIVSIIETALHNDYHVINGFANIESEEDFRSLTIPKVVFRPDGRLLYMSRNGIPANKKNEFQKAFKQVCVYAFTKNALQSFYENKSKTFLENIEDIEILRFLELGYEVKMVKLSSDSIAVDVFEDLEKVKNILNQNNL